jgi:signal transduction histidine kinase
MSVPMASKCYPQETEAALYFCTLEALQNVQKYAAASAVLSGNYS